MLFVNGLTSQRRSKQRKPHRREPALFCTDVLTALKQACRVSIAPFSVSGEYLRLRSESEGDSRLLVELFTILKRSGADQLVTYAAAEIARSLG